MKINELKVGDKIEYCWLSNYKTGIIRYIGNLYNNHDIKYFLMENGDFIWANQINVKIKSDLEDVLAKKYLSINKDMSNAVKGLTEKLLEFGGCNAHSRQIEKAFWAGFVEGYKINDK